MQRIELESTNYLVTIVYGYTSSYICYGCATMEEVYSAVNNEIHWLAEGAIESERYDDFDAEEQALVQMILDGAVFSNPVIIKKCFDTLYDDIFGMHYWVNDSYGNVVFKG